MVLLSMAIDHDLQVIKYLSVDMGDAQGWWKKGLKICELASQKCAFISSKSFLMERWSEGY